MRQTPPCPSPEGEGTLCLTGLARLKKSPRKKLIPNRPNARIILARLPPKGLTVTVIISGRRRSRGFLSDRTGRPGRIRKAARAGPRGIKTAASPRAKPVLPAPQASFREGRRLRPTSRPPGTTTGPGASPIRSRPHARRPPKRGTANAYNPRRERRKAIFVLTSAPAGAPRPLILSLSKDMEAKTKAKPRARRAAGLEPVPALFPRPLAAYTRSGWQNRDSEDPWIEFASSAARTSTA